MKLLIIHSSLRSGGAEKSLVSLLNEIDKNRFDIDLLLFSPEGLFLDQVPTFVNIITIPAPYHIPLLTNRKFIPKAFKNKQWRMMFTGLYILLREKFGRYIKIFELNPLKKWNLLQRHIPPLEQPYDIAFSYLQGSPTYFAIDKVSAKLKIAYIHNDVTKDNTFVKGDNAYYEKYDHIFSCSDTVKQTFDDRYVMFAAKSSELRNIVSPDLIKKMSQEYLVPEYDQNCVNILSIGRCNHQKGFDIAIEACSILKARGLKFRWYIIGRDGHLVEKLIKKYNVEDCFILLGERSNPYPYILNCTIYVQSSRYEGRSIAIDEAMVLKKPILSTNFATVSQQIEDGKNGIIVNMNASAIAEGVLKMINNPYSLRRMGNFDSFNINVEKELKSFYVVAESFKKRLVYFKRGVM